MKSSRYHHPNLKVEELSIVDLRDMAFRLGKQLEPLYLFDHKTLVAYTLHIGEHLYYCLAALKLKDLQQAIPAVQFYADCLATKKKPASRTTILRD